MCPIIHALISVLCMYVCMYVKCSSLTSDKKLYNLTHYQQETMTIALLVVTASLSLSLSPAAWLVS